MFTLQLLKSGNIKPEDLGPEKRFKIAEGLTDFPQELLALSEHIEILDMSGNNLTALPDNFSMFKHLKILFLSDNQFDHIPSVIADCPQLEMIGFKNNQIKEISETALPLKTRWLILTDNKIEKLPDSMGQLTRLKKLALAGNQLTALPETMSQCHELELIRLSANKFEHMPDWLFQLPKLAWLAFSGNPCTAYQAGLNTTIPEVELEHIQLAEQIGVGASGFIHKGQWVKGPHEFDVGADIAIKLFKKGNVTSDGYPQDELDACLAAGRHENLINPLAYIPNKSQLGLVMELIPPTYTNLGMPPDLNTCTRDTFNDDAVFNVDDIVSILKQMVSTIIHLHNQGVSHGDLYAHNILINSKNHILFGDFGAATHLANLTDKQTQWIEKIEVRALGNLIEDLFLQSKCALTESTEEKLLKGLILQCQDINLTNRPTLTMLMHALKAV